jgi:hypothetical protein
MAKSAVMLCKLHQETCIYIFLLWKYKSHCATKIKIQDVDFSLMSNYCAISDTNSSLELREKRNVGKPTVKSSGFRCIVNLSLKTFQHFLCEFHTYLYTVPFQIK